MLAKPVCIVHIGILNRLALHMMFQQRQQLNLCPGQRKIPHVSQRAICVHMLSPIQ